MVQAIVQSVYDGAMSGFSVSGFRKLDPKLIEIQWFHGLTGIRLKNMYIR